jgi:integrase
MADVYKQQTTVWRLDGRKVPAGTPGAIKVTTKSRKWYGTVNGEKTPLCADKAVARRMLNKMLADADLDRAGMGDVYVEHRRRPLSDHLADFQTALSAKGGSRQHVTLTVARIRSVLDGVRAVFLPDLDAVRAADFLASRRVDRLAVALPDGVEWFKPREAAAVLDMKQSAIGKAIQRNGLAAAGAGKSRRYPRATVQALAEKRQGTRGISCETFNHHVRALRSFGRWLFRSRRWPANPFDTLTLLAVSTDRRHDRRELTAQEIRRLLSAASASERTFRGLAGKDRAALYLMACGTGFRVRALAGLTPRDFDLSADVPVATLPARLSKNKRSKVQPLPADVADALRSFLDGKPLHKAVWPGNWRDDAAEMLRIDLDAAGIPFSVEGPDGPLFADFHALRHSYLTLGGRAGIDLRTLQELAGHSTPTLTARYSHRCIDDLAGAVSKLPRLLPESEEKHETIEVTSEKICREFTGADAFSRLSPSASVRLNSSERHYQSPSQPLDMSCLVSPCPSLSSVKALGLEPRTYGLKVRCSTN